MALFLDTFVNKIDRKGRVSVPATFRAALDGQAFHGIVALPVVQVPRHPMRRHRLDASGSSAHAAPASISSPMSMTT